MTFKKLYLFVVGFGIAAICAAVVIIFKSLSLDIDAKTAKYLLSFTWVFTVLVLVAAYVISSGTGRQLSRIINVLKEKSTSEVGEPSPINLPLTFNEIGHLSVTLNLFNNKFNQEIKRNEEAKRQLNKLDEEKGHFLAIISHELRTPLNTILGFSQLLIDGTEGELSDSQRENIKIIKHSGNNLLSLINDILDLSELESGRLQINPKEVDLADIIKTTIKEVSGQIRGKRTTIISDISTTPPKVYADPTRVYQILMNLLNNAVKFTPKGEIIVKTDVENDFVKVHVRDAGYGISPQDLPFIFMEFRQAGSMTSRRKGAGLGLAICKRLVNVQGGTISCESTPGKGSTFMFTLPVYRGQKKEPRSRPKINSHFEAEL